VSAANPVATTGAAQSAGARETAHIVFTLTLAGLLSGAAIVASYRATLPAIRAHQAEALRRAVFEVLPGTTEMSRLVWDGTALTPATAEASGDQEAIFAGRRADGSLVGYAIPAAGAGFQDTIKLLYGLDASGQQVIGMTVLESRETPGLGDRIYKDQTFVDEFRALAVDPLITLIKGHGTAPNEVDAITGATISSQAVVRILNEANTRWRARLPEVAAGDVAAAGGTAASPGDEAEPVVPGAELERGGPLPGGRPE
jgi:electron transport complex protein RnfG